MAAPQMENLLQAQETVLQDVEAFSYHWFDRRRTATRTALKAVQDVAKTGGRDSTVMINGAPILTNPKRGLRRRVRMPV